MPDTWEAVDPKTGKKWVYKDGTWVPSLSDIEKRGEESFAARFPGTFGAARALATGFGVLPESTDPLTYTGIPGFRQMISHPVETAKLLGESITGASRQRLEKAQALEKATRGADPLTRANAFLSSLAYSAEAFPVIGPFIGNIADELEEGIRGGDREKVAHAITSAFGGGLLSSRAAEPSETARAVGRTTGRGVRAVTSLPRTMAKEIAGGGPSMDRLIAAKDINALELKTRTLAPLEKAVHDDAQATIRTAVDRMEQNTPNVANKVDLADQVDKEWKEFVKIPETVPEPIRQLLGGRGSTGTPRALTGAELRAAQVANQLFKEGLSSKEVQSAMQNLGFTPKAVDGIMAVANPEADTGFWSPRELQQIRSKLGNVAFGRAGRSVPGPVRVAAVNTYRLISQIMEDTARKANALQTWQVGNQKWKLYNETFDGKWEGGEFHDSPLADALRGQTADEIMNALGKSKLQWTRDLTGRYQRFAPRAIADINRTLSRHDRLEMLRQFSHPSKWEATTALVFPFAPHVWEAMAGLRLLSPPILRRLATMGINPENVRGFPEVQPGLPEEPAPTAAVTPSAGAAPRVEGISMTAKAAGQTEYTARVNGKPVTFTAPSGLTRAEIEREAIFYSQQTP